MAEIEHRHLRSALEFVVLVAAEGQKRRPPLTFPRELKPFLAKPRLPTGALGKVRRVVESDDDFRAAIAAGALPELVDDVGRLWLDASPGWEERANEIVAERAAEAESSDLKRDLRRAEKRRTAAEQAAARIQAEVLVRDETIATLTAEVHQLRSDIAAGEEQLAGLRSELIDTRNDLRHAQDREAAARQRAEAATRSTSSTSTRQDSDGVDAVDDEQRERPSDADDRAGRSSDTDARLGDALEAARSFTGELERLLGASSSEVDETADRERRRPTNTSGRRRGGTARRPVALPGGVISTSAEAAAHLVRSDAAILVDGYNVAMLAWPGRSLEAQRDALIARVENLARRHGADITIVFDGDSVVGAHAARNRTIRIVYSPAGTTADDVIRSEVARLPAGRAVVVVTNDREIVDDVRRAGANVVPSNAFIAVF